MTVSRMLVPGTKLGPYQIVAAIGAGGMGEVYRARDPRLDRDVAIKLLPEAVSADRERLARFDAEARAVAALNHPNIVTIYSIEESGPTRFLTLELIEGRTLEHTLEPGGLPVGRVLELALALSAAVAAAHEKGVVHRDLKPANVMITRDGRVKVLDFGLAKLTDSMASPLGASDLAGTAAATVPSPVSATGQVLGTAPYMSPEQVKGEPLDARTDLFSIGAILYELLTGKRPFAGGSIAELGSAILRDTPAPLHEMRPDVPRDFERIVARCLEKDRDRRFQTAKDVHNELELVRRDLVAGDARPRPAAPASLPSVAVLPFANRSRDEEDEYFSDGLADELLAVLAKIRGLRVAARTSSFQFKGKSEDLKAIGEKLNVATVVEGSVRRAGNRVRISVQLVKVADGWHLWSETYDRTLDDIFAVQDDIAQSVVKELRTALLGADPDSRASGEVRAEVAEAARGRGVDAEAHRLYLQGSYLADRVNRTQLESGIRHLREAVARDPGHALAWARLSRACLLQSSYGWAPVRTGRDDAQAAAERAIAAEPAAPEGHLARAWVCMLADWNWQEARHAIERAAGLGSPGAGLLSTRASLSLYQGRVPEALADFERSLEIDPLSADTRMAYVMALRSVGRLEEARAETERVIEQVPDRILTRLRLALIALADGDREEALRQAGRETSEWGRLCALGIVHAARGEEAGARTMVDGLIGGWSQEAPYQIALVFTALGDRDRAFEWLERGIELRDSGVAHAKVEPLLRSLHADPRWQAFLEHMGLAD